VFEREQPTSVVPPDVLEQLRATYKACEPYLGARPSPIEGSDTEMLQAIETLRENPEAASVLVQFAQAMQDAEPDIKKAISQAKALGKNRVRVDVRLG